jgi:DNA-binding transcriptional MocR family regulator
MDQYIDRGNLGISNSRPKPPWTLAIEVAGGPRYLAIVEAVRVALKNGTLKPGERLPPQRELARILNLNLGTVTRAFDELRKAGLTRGEVGRGTYLAPGTTADGPDTLWDRSQTPGFIDLSHNFPEGAPGLAQIEGELSGFLREGNAERLLATQFDTGHAEHRAAAARWISQWGIAAPPERVIITCGAQHGLLLALGALSRPGDMVLTEELTFYGIKSAAAMFGRTLMGVRMDREGLVPQALDQACQRTSAKVLFCCPTLHNPTTATMSLERRHAIIQVCRKHDLIVVEDDVYGLMLDEPLPPLAALAPERVVHVTSLSKVAGPGLRIGFVAAPAEFTQPLGVALRATTLMASPLNAAVAQRLIDTGVLWRMAANIRNEIRARKDIVAQCLPAGVHVTQTGAFYFGLKVGNGMSGREFAQAAEQAGIGVTPYDVFEATPLAGGGMVRVCHSAAPDHESLRRALVGLRELLEWRQQ